MLEFILKSLIVNAHDNDKNHSDSNDLVQYLFDSWQLTYQVNEGWAGRASVIALKQFRYPNFLQNG